MSSIYFLVAASPSPLGAPSPVIRASYINMFLYTFILDGGLLSFDLTISRAVSLFILKRYPSVDCNIIGLFNWPRTVFAVLPNNKMNSLFPTKSSQPISRALAPSTLRYRLPDIVLPDFDTFKAPCSSTYFLLVKWLSAVGAALLVILSATRAVARSEERRVGKECRSRWSP